MTTNTCQHRSSHQVSKARRANAQACTKPACGESSAAESGPHQTTTGLLYCDFRERHIQYSQGIWNKGEFANSAQPLRWNMRDSHCAVRYGRRHLSIFMWRRSGTGRRRLVCVRMAAQTSPRIGYHRHFQSLEDAKAFSEPSNACSNEVRTIMHRSLHLDLQDIGDDTAENKHCVPRSRLIAGTMYRSITIAMSRSASPAPSSCVGSSSPAV